MTSVLRTVSKFRGPTGKAGWRDIRERRLFCSSELCAVGRPESYQTMLSRAVERCSGDPTMSTCFASGQYRSRIARWI